ncbi:hypothetical protein VNO77_37707 [Canavalia gladiata]|uniref:Uncharacterized protein n=1 Tax=Canavalia gladiata TaxID=3824 RepID=A0AAN9KBC6_CANGL
MQLPFFRNMNFRGQIMAFMRICWRRFICLYQMWFLAETRLTFKKACCSCLAAHLLAFQGASKRSGVEKKEDKHKVILRKGHERLLTLCLLARLVGFAVMPKLVIWCSMHVGL